jgi:hypothetical protein
MKQLYADSAPDRKAAIERANLVSDKQLAAMDQQSALTKDYADYQANTFRPLEKNIIADAEKFDTLERRNAEAGKAVSDVRQAFSSAQGITDRNLARKGVIPGSGADIAARQQMTAQQALAEVQGITGAHDKVQTQGYARRMDAASLGRNMAANQATSAGIALNQGNSAVANGQAAGNIAAQGAQLMNSGYAGAQNGLAGSANTYTNIANINQKANDNSGTMALVGSLAGTAAKMYMSSDVEKKEGIESINPDDALNAVNKTPIAEWQYKEGNQASDGGVRHTGPMAQDVQKNMGDKVAPNGKKIDIISMNGITMAAIQSLSKKVDSIVASQGINLKK